MPFRKLLIANRGEIAIRIARAAADAGLASVAIYPADDALSLLAWQQRRCDDQGDGRGRKRPCVDTW